MHLNFLFGMNSFNLNFLNFWFVWINKKMPYSMRCSDSLKKKLSAIPSPEREITTVSLKKDIKYGLGESSLVFWPQTHQVSTTSPGTSVSLLTLTSCLCFLLQASKSWAETTLATQMPAPSSALSLLGGLLMSTGASNLVRCWVSASFFSCLVSDFSSLLQVTASSQWTTSTSMASLMPLRWTSCKTLPTMSPWWCRSLKKCSTKVKEASSLCQEYSVKNPKQTLFPTLKFSVSKKTGSEVPYLSCGERSHMGFNALCDVTKGWKSGLAD